MSSISLNIAFVDNDQDDQWLFEEALDELPIKCTLKVFKTGQEFMNYLDTSPEKPDIIFLDLNMPVKSGFECLKEIKQNEKLKHINVIIYASHINEEYVERTFDFGANLYIKKPSNFNEIKKTLNEVLMKNWEVHNSNLNKYNFVYDMSTD
ncbi:response regulator [Gelidibacter gilvus]|uniref:Response regulator n=1 Tax=Gelidibacter gilvus TaxID=59602 RepID=A0A4Q0XB39_9FLAO|nr:response regulator [Gelidibacter gilvus]RXJ44357.1 response regulator [Gelidibacter gilvus]